MPLSKEKIEQIEGNILSIMNRNFMGNYTVMEHEMKKQLIYFIIQELTAEAEKALCLIEALEKIAYGYDNDDSRPGVHIGYSGAKSIATAALQEYTNLNKG